MNPYLALDLELACRLGYTDCQTHDKINKWILAWPPGIQSTNPFDRVTVPAWCCAGAIGAPRDNGAIVDLIAAYEVDILWLGACVRASAYDSESDNCASHEEAYLAHPDRATAMRYAVCKAVVVLLQHQKDPS